MKKSSDKKQVSIYPTKTLKQSKRSRKNKANDQPKSFIVMNDSGEFFAGFRKASFYWSADQQEAKHLQNIECLATIKRLEPCMEIIHDYV